ncbi:cucumber peeling cupredoxin-like [Momordica charantia]|uniref:Cucumber peeling cupredoxin-like n=1 Tax=Momordica charantia TaxID=3673 RepID=A0A6J1DBR9_MOMCH|nr:cucumber peeling cupredoxin-like [Momordica charantia]
MAGAGVALVLCFVAAVFVQHSAAEKVHVVGDATGWKVPDAPTFYSDWAAKNTFAIGDSLTFNFAANQHDVLEITKESFEACGSEDDALDKVMTTSPVTVKLTKAGDHYFMCTVGKHCLAGQKLSVTVGAGGASKTSPNAIAPSPANDSAAAAPALAKSPSSSSTPANASGSDQSAPAPAASSSSAVMASIFVTLSAIVMSFF